MTAKRIRTLIKRLVLRRRRKHSKNNDRKLWIIVPVPLEKKSWEPKKRPRGDSKQEREKLKIRLRPKSEGKACYLKCIKKL